MLGLNEPGRLAPKKLLELLALPLPQMLKADRPKGTAGELVTAQFGILCDLSSRQEQEQSSGKAQIGC